jgi:heme-degrading monooxygenase HmoA
MYINYFHYVLRDDCDVVAYQRLSDAMYAIVAGDPAYGFVSVERFGSDHEGVVLERFTSLEGAMKWAKCPEHRAAMRRGRSEFYERYDGAGTLVDHEYSYDRASQRGDDTFS